MTLVKPIKKLEIVTNDRKTNYIKSYNCVIKSKIKLFQSQRCRD